MVDIANIKKLREESGAGFLDCKKALAENGGDYQKAIDWLRKKGIASASKKGARSASDGLVGVTVQDSVAAIVEVNSETDFVAKNDKFQQLVGNISNLSLKTADLEILKASEYADGKSVADAVIDAISTIGENIVIRRVANLTNQNGFIASYVHNSISPTLGKIAVLISVDSDNTSDDAKQLAKQLAMHVAASRPVSVDQTGVSQEVINKEKEIFSEQAKASGKPDNIIEKMVEGRIRKFFEEVTLLEQPFVMDGKTKVKDVIADFNKANSCNLVVKEFIRFELGEGIEKEVENFADEVNKVVSSS